MRDPQRELEHLGKLAEADPTKQGGKMLAKHRLDFTGEPGAAMSCPPGSEGAGRKRILATGQRAALRPYPWAPLPKPVSELRLALVSSGGVYREDHEPFDAANPIGDWSFRVIPGDTQTSALRVAHGHYDHEEGADQDINVVFPLDRLREMEARGNIGELAPVHISFMGYIRRPEKIAEEMPPKVIKALKEAKAEAVMMVPV